jgi:hypothetical protein
MPVKMQLDEGAYARMLDCITVFYASNKPGQSIDTDFIKDDYWLQNTAVIENIERRNGCWNIFLVFAHHLQPLKFIKRSITHFACFKKAALTAHYMRRLAAKDQRGTLVVAIDKYNFIFN